MSNNHCGECGRQYSSNLDDCPACVRHDNALTTTKHTPTPWEFDPSLGHNAVCARGLTGRPYRIAELSAPSTTSCEDEANARRIVQCVNACEGIDDPHTALCQAPTSTTIPPHGAPSAVAGIACSTTVQP
jgi:hypothetical protein